MKKWWCVGALLLGGALAVQLEPLMPLASVAGVLKSGWKDPNFLLVVGEAGEVQVGLTGAAWSAGVPGDDRYGPGEVQTNFELQGPGVMVQSSYGNGPEQKVTFFSGTLQPGQYRLSSTTYGKGKNSFALWVSGNHLQLSSSSLAFTSTSKSWSSVLRITEDKTVTLKLDDTEDARELGVRFVVGNKVQDFPQVKNGMLLKLKGPGRLEVKQPEGARQKSNTFRVSAFVNEKPEPLEFTPQALPESRLIGAMVLIDGKLYPSAGKLKTPEGEYVLGSGEKLSTRTSQVVALPLPGLLPVAGSPTQGKEVTLVYRPVIDTTLDKASCLPLNQAYPWQVTLDSEAAQALPVTLRVRPSDGLSTDHPDEISTLLQGHLVWVIPLKAEEGGQGQLQLEVNGETTSLDLPGCAASPEKPLP